MDTYYIQH